MNTYLKNALNSLDYDYTFPPLNLKFKFNSDVGLILKRITDQVLLNEIPKFKQEYPQDSLPINKLIEEAIKSLPDVQEDMEELIHHFSAILVQSFELLKSSIAPEVESIYTEINELTDREMLISRDTSGVPQLDTATIELELINPLLVASKVDDIDNITQVLHGVVGIKAKDPSIHNVTLLWAKLSCPKFTDEEREYFKEFIKLIEIDLNKELPIITKDILRDIPFHRPHINIDSHLLKFLVDTIEYILPYVSSMTSVLDSVVEQYKNTYTEYVNYVKLYLDLCAYTLYCTTVMTTFNNSLVYNNRTVNAVKFEEFERQGYSLQQIQQMLRVFYNDNQDDFLNRYYGTGIGDKLPLYGLTIGQTIEKINKSTSFIEQAQASFIRRYELSRKTATAKAMNSVLKNYISTFKEPLNGYTNVEQMIREVTDKMIPAYVNMIRHSSNETLEHFIYLFILQLKYPKHLVEVVYRKLGKQYTALFDKENTITDDQLLFTDLSIMAEILIEFLINEMTVKV